MKGRRVAVAAAFVIVGLVLALGWWQRDRAHHAPADARTPADETEARRDTATRARGTADHSWSGQPGVAPRRVAGLVLFDGEPIAATVTLGTDNGFGQADVALNTGADGRFEFAPQPAVLYVVTATRQGTAPAQAMVDLRDPTTAPENIVLELSPCTYRLTGTVRDSAGGVIVGASVRPQTWLWRGPAVHTDDEGAYAICGPQDLLGLEYSADGYGSMSVRLEFTGDSRYDARLVPEAVVSGRVEGSDGVPIAHAAVVAQLKSWSSLETAGAATTESGADGRFELHGVAPGRMLIAARARGWAPSGETEVTTSAATSTEDVVVRMTRGAVLRGRATLEGEPAAGVTMAWKPNGEPAWTATAVTQTDGIFVLDGFAPDEGTLVAYGFDVKSPGTLAVSADRRKDVDVVLEPQASIVGRVTRQGRPTAGAQVAAHSRDTWLAQTDADGRFELLGAPTGSIKVSAKSDREGAFAPDRFLEIAPGQRYELDFELVGAGRISGVLVASDGTPLVGAKVHASLVGGDDIGTAGTRANGSFMITALSGGGSYELRVTAPNSSTPLPPATEFPHVDVADGETHVRDIRIVVQAKRAMIAGVVVDEAGAPVPDARISAQFMTGKRLPYVNGWTQLDRTTTDTEGTFELPVYGPATYALEAESNGDSARVGGINPGTRDVRIVLLRRTRD